MVTITITGQAKTGKTTIATVIARVLQEKGIRVDWQDTGDACENIHRLTRLADNDVRKICPHVQIITKQLLEEKKMDEELICPICNSSNSLARLETMNVQAYITPDAKEPGGFQYDGESKLDWDSQRRRKELGRPEFYCIACGVEFDWERPTREESNESDK